MDNLSHTMTAFALSRAWSARTVPEAATLVVSANLPDLDVIVESILGLERDRLFAHRGITHSLAAAPIEAVVTATLIWMIGRVVRNGWSHSSWGRLVLLASAGLAVHLLLDLSNQYGVQLLLPFDARWYAWDLTGLVDFWILAILAVGWFVPMVARLHGVEPDRLDRLGRLTAVASLALIAGYLGAQQISHRLALESLDRQDASHRHSRIACLPGSISPFRWTGVLETDTRFEIHDIEVPAGVLRTRQVLPKDCDRRLEQAVRRNPRVRALLSFARFPIFRASPWTTPSGAVGHTVLVEDVRWLAPRGYIGGPFVRLWMDDDLNVVRENAVAWR